MWLAESAAFTVVVTEFACLMRNDGNTKEKKKVP
jgi:hypothetical protein